MVQDPDRIPSRDGPRQSQDSRWPGVASLRASPFHVAALLRVPVATRPPGIPSLTARGGDLPPRWRGLMPSPPLDTVCSSKAWTVKVITATMYL